MSAKKKIFEVNDRVFAKVRGFPAWPARIMEVANVSGSRYKVFFFGTYETATLKKEEIWEYNASSITKFGKGNQKRKGFAEGMYEIENMPDLKTAETLEAEGGPVAAAAAPPVAATVETPEEPMDTSSVEPEEAEATTPPPTVVPASSSLSTRTTRDKTPKASTVKTEKATSKASTPTVNSKGGSKTPASSTKSLREKTPRAAKGEDTTKETLKKDPAPVSSKKVEIKEDEVEEQPSTPQPEMEEKEEDDVKAVPEEASGVEIKKDIEEEENNEVVTSSGDVKSTPADTTTTEEEPPVKKDSTEPSEEQPPSESTVLMNETTPVSRTRNSRSAASSSNANKRKATEDLTPSAPPPPAKKKNVPPPSNVTPSTNDSTNVVGPSPSATVSRSGRIIKPKKFVDDEDDIKPPPVVEAPPVPQAVVPPASEPVTSTQTSASTPKTTTPPKKEPRKMWVEVKSTGDMIEINLDQDKPSQFESKEAVLQWEKTTARNALKFKERVESGDFIPDEVRVKLEEKLHRTEEEEKILKKARNNSLKMERIRWLKIEQRIIDLDIDIKSYCSTSNPDLKACLKALTEFDSMTLAPLMLKKQPTIVGSVSKLRFYVGPKDALGGVYELDAEKIRNMAEKIYRKLKAIFGLTDSEEEVNFDEYFWGEVSEFRNSVKSMEKEKLLTLVSDPTKKAKKKK